MALFLVFQFSVPFALARLLDAVARFAELHRDGGRIVVVITLGENAIEISSEAKGILAGRHFGYIQPLAVQFLIVNIFPSRANALVIAIIAMAVAAGCDVLHIIAQAESAFLGTGDNSSA